MRACRHRKRGRCARSFTSDTCIRLTTMADRARGTRPSPPAPSRSVRTSTAKTASTAQCDGDLDRRALGQMRSRSSLRADHRCRRGGSAAALSPKRASSRRCRESSRPARPACPQACSRWQRHASHLVPRSPHAASSPAASFASRPAQQLELELVRRDQRCRRDEPRPHRFQNAVGHIDLAVVTDYGIAEINQIGVFLTRTRDEVGNDFGVGRKSRDSR